MSSSVGLGSPSGEGIFEKAVNCCCPCWESDSSSSAANLSSSYDTADKVLSYSGKWMSDLIEWRNSSLGDSTIKNIGYSLVTGLGAAVLAVASVVEGIMRTGLAFVVAGPAFCGVESAKEGWNTLKHGLTSGLSHGVSGILHTFRVLQFNTPISTESAPSFQGTGGESVVDPILPTAPFIGYGRGSHPLGPPPPHSGAKPPPPYAPPYGGRPSGRPSGELVLPSGWVGPPPRKGATAEEIGIQSRIGELWPQLIRNVTADISHFNLGANMEAIMTRVGGEQLARLEAIVAGIGSAHDGNTQSKLLLDGLDLLFLDLSPHEGAFEALATEAGALKRRNLTRRERNALYVVHDARDRQDGVRSRISAHSGAEDGDGRLAAIRNLREYIADTSYGLGE